MSTATDKAIPTWGEVKQSTLSKSYHFMWYYDITKVTTISTSCSNPKSIITHNEHKNNEISLFSLSLGEDWRQGTNMEVPYRIFPVYSCMLMPCSNVHGSVMLPKTTIQFTIKHNIYQYANFFS